MAVAPLWRPMQLTRATLQLSSEEVVSTWFYWKSEPISLQQPGQIAFILAAWQQPWRGSWFVWTMSLTFKCYSVSGQKSINNLALSVIQSRFSPSWCVAAANIWEMPSFFTKVTCNAFPRCCLCHGTVPPCKAEWYISASNMEFLAKPCKGAVWFSTFSNN